MELFSTASALIITPAKGAAKINAGPVQVAGGIRQWTGFLAKQAASAKTPQLAKSTKRAVGFWNAVKRLNTASSKLERDLAAKRPSYLDALRDTRSALTSVEVTYRQSEAKDSGVDKALTNIDRGVALLENNAGLSQAGKPRAKGGERCAKASARCPEGEAERAAG